ncbi:hypothetical protein DFP72DRAFT_941097 [Ephemerocybe angulata]|uniref:Uncharacterized protein n=1 Tax=Ephemerocybe angulata TaxID=980116 RepID=A0A8H6H7H6_9AGAR|nr:hypothetical protein DFP72DRAFT_941097 [Tulosesus angulatus]
MESPSIDNTPAMQDIPEDLVRLIFEAAVEDIQEPNWACARVSKAVQSWVEPLLYRRITLKTRREITLLYRTILSTVNPPSSGPSCTRKPRQFFRNHVRLLDIDLGSASFETTFAILSACTSVTHLRFGPGLRERAGTPPRWGIGVHSIWNKLRLNRLSISSSMVFPIYRQPHAEGPPLLNHITHLHLIWEPSDGALDCTFFSSLKSLTHFCLTLRQRGVTAAAYSLEAVRSITPHFPPSLAVYVVHVPFLDFCNRRGGANPRLFLEGGDANLDQRVVIAVSKSYYLSPGRNGEQDAWIERFATWGLERYGTSGTNDEEALWDRAEAMVSRRKAEAAFGVGFRLGEAPSAGNVN